MSFSEAVNNITYLDGNGNSKVLGYITEPSQVMVHETLHSMSDVYRFLLRLMNDKIKINNVKMNARSVAECPEINVEYIRYPDLTACTVSSGLIQNTGYVDTCSHDDTLDYLKREMKKQFTEELERAKIKEEPKEEETMLEFKEISW